jgi:hypothetical protein
MAHIQTWTELQARELTPAEEQLINTFGKGDFVSSLMANCRPMQSQTRNRGFILASNA